MAGQPVVRLPVDDHEIRWWDVPEGLGAASCLLACMDFERLVIRDGDRVAASGRLVRDSRGDWFQPSLPVALPGGVERTVRPAGRLAIRVVGADLDVVVNRFEKAGAIEGWAAVEGVWSGEQLEVDRQSLPSPEPPWSHPWRTPPCPPPAGGWPKVTPRGDMVLKYDMGDLRATAAAVAVTLFRPADGAAVLVVAASDEAAVEAQLRPQLGDLLCVVPSRWTKAELDRVCGYLHEHHEQWDLYQWGPHVQGDGQPCVSARLVRVLPEIAAWAASLPAGILVLEPWLAPQRAS
jgi:hypothetical protein